jgi:hypothetical protein
MGASTVDSESFFFFKGDRKVKTKEFGHSFGSGRMKLKGALREREISLRAFARASSGNSIS